MLPTLAVLLAFLLAFVLGCVCGLRSMTGPALVCWAAHLGWLHLDATKLAFLHNPISLAVFTLLAVGELVADKLPFIPNRIEPGPLGVRFVFGALCGSALLLSASAAAWLWLPSALAGGLGGIAGAFAGYRLRRWLTVGRGLPDLPIALLEDGITIGAGLLVVSGVLVSVSL
jgi:uncharacterized membrane protein